MALPFFIPQRDEGAAFFKSLRSRWLWLVIWGVTKFHQNRISKNFVGLPVDKAGILGYIYTTPFYIFLAFCYEEMKEG